MIERLTFNRHFSPNGDGRFDYVQFALRLRHTDDATISIVTRDGGRVRTLAENLRLSKARRYHFRWNGRTESGVIAGDGEYHVRVGLRRQGRVVTSGRKIFLDTVPPRPLVGFVKPSVLTPGGGAAAAMLRYSGPTRRPLLLVYRSDGKRPVLVARHAGRSGSDALHWDGRVGLGSARRLASPGSYLLAVRARDAAGNLGPVDLPPRREDVRGHPGLIVRYLGVEPARRAVPAGAVTSFHVLAGGHRYRWRVHRLGERRSTSRGVSRDATLHVRAPRGGSGIALLELHSGAHRYATPFAVQGRRRRPVLVVLPTITWQSLNPVESNGDGYPDTLPAERSVALDRPFAGRGRPAGFSATAALVAYLRRSGLRYDIKTDLELARGEEASLGRYRGVLIAGSERFAPATLTRPLAAYVKAGGRLAWVGTRGFSQNVAIDRESIVRGRPGSFLGERVRVETGPRALVVLGDRIDFFGGVSGAFGPFPRVEPSLQRPAGGRLLASAGAEPGRPDIVVYRFAKGVVARVGVDGFGHSLVMSPSTSRIMRRLWDLLSR